MSGIAGIVHFDGRPVAPGQIEAMTAAMGYRGPDGINHWVNDSVALGQCMLRTTPESLEETQPLANEDASLVLVMDGRIDNWEELRRELMGHGAHLRTCADAELLLRAYETWGERCVERVDGDFVFAIVAPQRREVFIARDRIGVKPIYLWETEHSIRFASDSHALLTLPGSPRTINDKMVAQHLRVACDDLQETLVKNITRLPPAFWLKRSPDINMTHRYWDPAATQRLCYRRPEQYAEHFSELLDLAVRCRLRGQGDAGCYLSGGVDSSTILSIGARQYAAMGTLRSYSLVFPGDDCDESKYIRLMNQVTGTEGVSMRGLPCMPDHYFTTTARFKDVTDSPNGAMLNVLRSAAHQQGVRVILTGYGADEWYGKSPYYYCDLLRTRRFSSLASEVSFSMKSGTPALQVIKNFVSSGLLPLAPPSLIRAMRSARSRFRKGPTGDGGYSRVISDELADRFPASIEPASSRHGNTPTIAYLLDILRSGFNIRGLEIESRAAALFGIEERSPFYDRRLIEFAFSIPEERRSAGGGKWVVREAMKGQLPEQIRQRQDKAEFSAVLARTLMMPEMRRALHCPRLTDHGWIDPAKIHRAFTHMESEYRGGDPRYGRHAWPLWMALCLEQACNAITDTA